jgi:hypothetical protein
MSNTKLHEAKFPCVCFRCDKKLIPDYIDHFGSPLNPLGGIEFDATGNYGSAIFDPLNDFGGDRLRIFICDDCAKTNSKLITYYKERKHTDCMGAFSFEEYLKHY